MAILCRHHSEMDMCAEFLRKRKLPHQLRRNSSSVFDPAHDSIKVMTLHVSKGLEFPVVALVGVGHMPTTGEDEREEARLFCDELVIESTPALLYDELIAANQTFRAMAGGTA